MERNPRHRASNRSAMKNYKTAERPRSSSVRRRSKRSLSEKLSGIFNKKSRVNSKYEVPRKKVRFTKKFFIFAGLFVAAVAIIITSSMLFGSSGVDSIKLDMQSGSQITSSDSAVYALNGTTLTSYDLKGKTNWNVSFKTENPKLTNSNNIICVYNDSVVNVLGVDKTAGVSITAEDFTIKSVKCGVNSIAMLTESTNSAGDTTYYIRVYTFDGIELDKTEITNGIVTEYGFYDAADNLYMLTLDTTGVVPVSRFATFSPSQKSYTGLIGLSDNVVTDVYFANSMIYLAGTTSVSYYAYNSYSEKSGDILTYGLTCVDTVTTENSFTMYYTPAMNNPDGFISTLHIVSKDASNVTVSLPDNVFHIAATSKNIYCFTSEGFYTYKQTGEIVEFTELSHGVQSVEKLAPGRLLIRSEEGVYMYNID